MRTFEYLRYVGERRFSVKHAITRLCRRCQMQKNAELVDRDQVCVDCR